MNRCASSIGCSSRCTNELHTLRPKGRRAFLDGERQRSTRSRIAPGRNPKSTAARGRPREEPEAQPARGCRPWRVAVPRHPHRARVHSASLETGMGIETKGAHVLRRSAATSALAGGADLVSVPKLLGHQHLDRRRARARGDGPRKRASLRAERCHGSVTGSSNAAIRGQGRAQETEGSQVISAIRL